jgi:hypothetical protein
MKTWLAQEIDATSDNMLNGNWFRMPKQQYRIDPEVALLPISLAWIRCAGSAVIASVVLREFV